MKHILLFTALFLGVQAVTFSQKTAKSKTVAKKKITKTTKAKTVIAPQTVSLEMFIKNDDGSSTMEPLAAGDKLIYAVNAGGQQYDFIVTLRKANYETGIEFDYEMTNGNKTKGHVKIDSKAKSESKKYLNYFKGGKINLTDACTVWMTYANFMDMPEKKTEMTLDDNETEIFYRPEKDEVTPTINFKGKPVKIDGFMINNAEDMKGDKTMWIQNSSSNSLILKMDLGWTIELKEIK
ncbi:MAG: hypothetical protein IPP48_08610 [Chitinophagaceae bacterium]|nr:hypothetical protein [Chitinophagaceae bacterium]